MVSLPKMRICKYLFIIIFYSTFLSATEASNQVDVQKYTYQIVVDAGSTGTRLHIFKNSTSANGSKLPDIDEIYYDQINTGIASHINSQREITDHLSAIFNPAQRFCFQAKIPCTNAPIYFLATGGARILKPSQQRNLFSYVRNWLEDYSMFQNVVETRILTGKEEAELGWLTSFEDEIRHNRPLGAYFELGGASLQYAYVLENSKGANTHFKTGNKDIYLNTGSWLGFGVNEATNRVMSYWHVSESVCYPSGVSKQSQFNYSKCFKLFENYLNSNEQFAPHQTYIKNIIEQNKPIKLGAAFYYLIPHGFGVKALGNFHGKLKQVCTMPWRQIRANYVDLVSVHQIDLCAHGTYLLAIFSALDLPKDYTHYSFNSLGWARGVIIQDWISK